jgi:hypothetical protein
MKVFNLTDMETPALAQRGLSNHTIAVGSFLLAPGASQEVSEEQIRALRPGLQQLVSVGALALGDQPPASYVLQKDRAQSAPAPAAPSKKKGG